MRLGAVETSAERGVEMAPRPDQGVTPPTFPTRRPATHSARHLRLNVEKPAPNGAILTKPSMENFVRTQVLPGSSAWSRRPNTIVKPRSSATSPKFVTWKQWTYSLARHWRGIAAKGMRMRTRFVRQTLPILPTAFDVCLPPSPTIVSTSITPTTVAPTSDAPLFSFSAAEVPSIAT